MSNNLVVEHSHDDEDVLLNKILHHYRIDERVGHGGMSIVYRAWDLFLDRKVAVKLLYPFLAEKAEFRARLAREAHAVARLEHPHILKIFDYSGDISTLEERPFNKQNTPQFHALEKVPNSLSKAYIVTEFVDGLTLKDFANSHNMWETPELGAYCVWQLTKALEHAHSKGVIHRDLKPENIMIRKDGHIKLMDFGIAHVSEAQSLTLTGTLIGSPAHMAPECIEGKDINEKSDIFSLGTVLYWICTGVLPFSANSPHALLKAIVDGNCKPAQQHNTKIHDQLSLIICKAMDVDCSKRFQTVGEFTEALHHFMLLSQNQCESKDLKNQLKNYPENKETIQVKAYKNYFVNCQNNIKDPSQTAKVYSHISRLMAERPDDPQTAKLLEEISMGGFNPESQANIRIESEKNVISNNLLSTQTDVTLSDTFSEANALIQQETNRTPLKLILLSLCTFAAIIFALIFFKTTLKSTLSEESTLNSSPKIVVKTDEKNFFQKEKLPVLFPGSDQNIVPNDEQKKDKKKYKKVEDRKSLANKKSIENKKRVNEQITTKKEIELQEIELKKRLLTEAAKIESLAKVPQKFMFEVQINIPSTLIVDGKYKHSILGQKK